MLSDPHELIAMIYEAALCPEKWQQALVLLSDKLEFSDVALAFVDTKMPKRNLVINTGHSGNSKISEDVAIALRQQIDPKHLGSLISSNHHPQLAFNPATEPPSIHNSMVPLFLGNSICAILLLQSASPIDESQQLFIGELIPHFIKSVHIHNHLSALKHRNDTLLETLERTNVPVFILNSNLETIFVSREAEILLKRNRAISLGPNGHLRVHFPDEQNQLQKILKDFLNAGFHATYLVDKGTGIPIHHPDNDHPLRMCFVLLQKAEMGDPNQPFVAIFAYDPAHPRQISAEYLKQVFRLTPTEIHTAQLLVSGYSIAEIAEARGTTLETTRWQMKQLLQKTNTHSQAELARLLIVIGKDLNETQTLFEIPPKDLSTLYGAK